MAQVLTSELEALLVSTLQVGDDKPRGEIEIDYVTGVVQSGLLDSGGAGTGAGATVSTFVAPAVDSAEDGVFLVACVQTTPQRPLVLPAGWTARDTIDIPYSSFPWRVTVCDRYVPTAAGPYADEFEVTGGAARWSLPQLLLKALGGTAPLASGSGQGGVWSDSPVVVDRSATATLDDVVPEGSVMVAFVVDPYYDTGSGTGVRMPSGWRLLLTAPDVDVHIRPVQVWIKVSGEAEAAEPAEIEVVKNYSHQIALTLQVVVYPLLHEEASVTDTIKVASFNLDRSRKMAAAQLDATLDNEANVRGWYQQAIPFMAPNNPVRAYAWYGDRDNRVRVFTGILDRIHEHRNPRTLTLKARSRSKWLITQGFRSSAPQGVDDEGAVRTEDNGVYIGKSIEYIVGDILDRAGWPADDRAIATTGITLSEYVLSDKGSWLDQIVGEDRLTTAAGCDWVEDELGIAHFEPSPLVAAVEPTPAWEFAAGVNVMALDHEVDDEARATRVEVAGPMTSSVPVWKEVWSTSKLNYPCGAWYDPDDPDYLRIVDRITKKIYRMKQSDRSIASSKYLGGYLLGLSGIPGDADHYLVLIAPWRSTGSTSGNAIRKYAKADNSLVDTYPLPNGRWSALKSDGTNIWLANYDNGKLYQRSMTGTAVDDFTIVYGGVTQDAMTGLWINGTTMGLFFSAHKRFLVVDSSDPETVLSVQSTKGTRIAGGDADTDTDVDLYAVAGKGSWGLPEGMVAKFTLAELVTTDVTALAIDYDLEDALGFQSGIAVRDHAGCPNSDDPHPFESRLATYSMKVVQSLDQAQDVADAQLRLLKRLRRVMDLATTGNPGIQLNDPIRHIDAIAGTDATWVIDSYRKQLSATYTATLSVLPWEAP